MNIPRPEHPKMQFRRDNWQNLNGTWQFEIDNGRSGKARGLAENDAALSSQITVPFCPESALSGVEHKDFMYGVWYKRAVTISPEDLTGLVRLHFGAVDYRCTVYINGIEAGTHTGGYTSFYFDIAHLLQPGENVITVYAEDDTRDPMIPRGKQSEEFFSHGCDYTRTTGIWQTVWMEFLPQTHIEAFRIDTEASTGQVNLSLRLCGSATLTVKASYKGSLMAETSVTSSGGSAVLNMTLAERHLWEVGRGRLYDLELTYGDDTVHSYFGLRSVAMNDHAFLLNGRSVFQRLVLDQGFYPDGIYTAPSDEALERDIKLSMAMGFNGARLHEKVFEERFLYHCDRLGYLAWGEYPNWGLDHTRPEAIYGILPEWLSEVQRDYNHPAIIGWCPFNETWDRAGHAQYDPLLALVYRATKAIDPNRPCIDTSGNFHVETDIFDLHDYEQDAAVFASHYPVDDPFVDRFAARQPYNGKPVFISEYGGIGYSIGSAAWSYGSAARTEEEYIQRFTALTKALLKHPRIFGLCYTQLTDVEQEQNGVYTYHREPKVDPAIFHAILSQKAAIED